MGFRGLSRRKEKRREKWKSSWALDSEFSLIRVGEREVGEKGRSAAQGTRIYAEKSLAQFGNFDFQSGVFSSHSRLYARAVCIRPFAFESGGTMVVGPGDELTF